MNPENTPQIAVPVPQVFIKMPKASVFLKEAFSNYKNNIVLIASVFAAPFILSLMQIFRILPSFSIIWSLIAGILSYLATIGLIYVLIKNDESKKNVESVFNAGLHYFFPALWINVLATVAMIGGYVLFVVPGIIISLLLSFALYVFISEDARGMNALIKSWHYVKGSVWELLGKLAYFGIFLFILFMVLGIVAVFFGHNEINPLTGKVIFIQSYLAQVIYQVFSVFFVTPLGLMYSLSIFKSLSTSKGELSGEASIAIKKKINIFAILGTVVAVILLVAMITTIISFITGAVHINTSFMGASAFSTINPIFNFVK